MAFTICKVRRNNSNAGKRQRSKLRKVSGPRSIGVPTGLKVNPLPNPGDPGFKVLSDMVPISSMSELRPISITFLAAAKDPNVTALETVCEIMTAIEGKRPNSEPASLRSAQNGRAAFSSQPPPPTRAPPPPPPAPLIRSRSELPRKLMAADPEPRRAERAVERAVHSRDLDKQEPDILCSTRLFPLSRSVRTDSRASSSSSNKISPVKLGISKVPQMSLANDTSAAPPQLMDPHSIELYQAYKYTGEILYCIPDPAFDEDNKYTWQHCWSLINAYIHGTDIGDIDFADRIMDILEQQIAPGVCADSNTIRHIFTADGISEQLRRFVVNRSIDADANSFRREQTRRSPKLYVLMILEAVTDRLCFGVRTSSLSSEACEYHLHGDTRRCYRMEDVRQEETMTAEAELPGTETEAMVTEPESDPDERREERMKANEEDIAKAQVEAIASESEREPDLCVETAKAVRMVKVGPKSIDGRSLGSKTGSLRSVGEINIKRMHSSSRKNEMLAISNSSGPEVSDLQHENVRETRELLSTANDCAEAGQNAILFGIARGDDGVASVPRFAHEEPTDLPLICSHCEGVISMNGQKSLSSTPSRDAEQLSSDLSVHKSPESTLPLEFPGSAANLAPALRDIMSLAPLRRPRSVESLVDMRALPGAFPSSQIAA